MGKNVKKKYCPFCGRKNSDLPTREVVWFETTVTAPFCLGVPEKTCPPLSAEERLDPEMRRYHTQLGDFQRERLDPEIAPLVLLLNERGFHTLFSCSGHGKRAAYVTFWDEVERAKVAELVGDIALRSSTLQSILLGPIYQLHLQGDRLLEAVERVRADNKAGEVHGE